MINEKQIFAGKLLNVDFYPCFKNGRRIPSKPSQKRGSTEAQEKYNRNQAVKEAIMLVNENFDNNDTILALTYKPKNAPKSAEELHKDVTNYLRRVKRLRKKELKRVTAMLEALPDNEIFKIQRKELELKKSKLEAPFKYFYTREEEIYQRGPYAGKSNFHPHIFITGGIDRKVLEDMWPHGARCNAERFQPERFGPETMSKYMMKDPRGGRRFCCSKNMSRKYKSPKIKNSRFSPRKLEKIAKQRVDDAEFWEKKYKGYRFLRSFPRFNEYNGHWYMSVVMYASDDELPEWTWDDWPNDDWG